jgi:hypothetical protein
VHFSLRVFFFFRALFIISWSIWAWSDCSSCSFLVDDWCVLIVNVHHLILVGSRVNLLLTCFDLLSHLCCMCALLMQHNTSILLLIFGVHFFLYWYCRRLNLFMCQFQSQLLYIIKKFLLLGCYLFPKLGKVINHLILLNQRSHLIQYSSWCCLVFLLNTQVILKHHFKFEVAFFIKFMLFGLITEIFGTLLVIRVLTIFQVYIEDIIP